MTISYSLITEVALHQLFPIVLVRSKSLAHPQSEAIHEGMRVMVGPPGAVWEAADYTTLQIEFLSFPGFLVWAPLVASDSRDNVPLPPAPHSMSEMEFAENSTFSRAFGFGKIASRVTYSCSQRVCS